MMSATQQVDLKHSTTITEGQDKTKKSDKDMKFLFSLAQNILQDRSIRASSSSAPHAMPSLADHSTAFRNKY
jgi:hypothetical protein